VDTEVEVSQQENQSKVVEQQEEQDEEQNQQQEQQQEQKEEQRVEEPPPPRLKEDSVVTPPTEKRASTATSSRFPKRASLSAGKKRTGTSIVPTTGAGGNDQSSVTPIKEADMKVTNSGSSSHGKDGSEGGGNMLRVDVAGGDDDSSSESSGDEKEQKQGEKQEETTQVAQRPKKAAPAVSTTTTRASTTASSTTGTTASSSSSSSSSSSPTSTENKISAGPFADVTTEQLLEQLEGLRFEDFILKNFNLNRKGVGKTQTTIEKISNWKKDLIKLSLLSHSESDIEKAAVQVFRNITGYMGDRRSKKSKLQHIKKMYNAVQTHSNSKFQDEIYCQICKQTNKNPSLASTINGWEIMMLCLAVFPPSANLMLYLMAYCASVVESVRSNDKVVLKYAEICLHNVQKISALGRQMENPSDEDIERIRNGTVVYNLKSYQI